MPDGTQAAVTEATRLGEIGFPEFTAKLITDTFDAIVAANLRQTEAYIELVSKVTKSLGVYINETKDDIGGELILQFLAKTVPNKDPTVESGTNLSVDGKLDAVEVTKLKEAVKVEGEADDPKVTALVANTAIAKDTYDAILQAVAKRIAADKYTLLKEMVKMGVLRLVVEHGIIETRLTFNTYGSTFYESQKSSFNRSDFNFRAKAKTGGFLSAWVSASASTSYNKVSISTSRETNRDVSGSQVQIYGRVQIDFKTDYQPLRT